MSDPEDDAMDVDAPNVEDAMAFSAAATSNKGKRSAANLPVELEDSLPWYLDIHVRTFSSRIYSN